MTDFLDSIDDETKLRALALHMHTWEAQTLLSGMAVHDIDAGVRAAAAEILAQRANRGAL